MNLCKTNRQHQNKILTGIFCLAMLQSSTLRAASEISEDPAPAGAVRPVFGGMALPGMGPGELVPASAALEAPAANTGAGAIPRVSGDAESVLSDHESDDDILRGLVAEARAGGFQRDSEIKKGIRGKRWERKQREIFSRKDEREALRAALLAKIGKPERAKEVPDGDAGCATAEAVRGDSSLSAPAAGSGSGGGASSAVVAAALAAERSAAAAQIAQLQAAAAESARSAEAALAAERAAAAKIAQLEAARREAEAAARAQREQETARREEVAAERAASAAQIAQLRAAAAEAARSRLVASAAGSASSPMAAAAAPSASAGSGGASAGAGVMVSIPQTVPAMAVGHEALYQRLLGGRLEYRPTSGSDAGLVTLSIGDLLRPLTGTANPLSATFDLSRCGDAWKYLSINIGYKKAPIPANANKTEVWICPKFLAEKERPSQLSPIMGKWEAPVGYFYTWGGDDDASAYYYSLEGIVMDNDKNLYEKWRYSHNTYTLGARRPRRVHINSAILENFLVK